MHSKRQISKREYLRVIEHDAEAGGYMIQGSSQPIIDCESDLGLEWVCGSCRDVVLVVNADPEILFGVRIQCHRCKAVNETPFSSGESVPFGGFCFDKGAHYPFNSTVYPKGVPIMSQPFVDSCKQYTPLDRAPRAATVPDDVFNAVKRLDARSGQRVQKLLRSIERAPSTGKDRIHPMLAAYVRAKESMKSSNTLYSDDLDELMIFHEFYGQWEHHPRSKVIIDGLCNEYDHSLIMLFAASFLARNGIGITFGSIIQSGKANTDLYARLALHEILHFEVKVPSSRMFGVARENVGLIVRSAWKKVRSRRQISQSSTGCIVIGRIAANDSLFEELNHEVESLLGIRGRDNRHVEGVLAVELPVRGVVVPDGVGGARMQAIPSPRFHSNPFYVGKRRIGFRHDTDQGAS